MEVELEYLGALTDLDYSSLLYFVKKLVIQHYKKKCMYTVRSARSVGSDSRDISRAIQTQTLFNQRLHSSGSLSEHAQVLARDYSSSVLANQIARNEVNLRTEVYYV